MLSINTNLSSLIAQNSMKSSTNKLNQAIERMTTGSKINHAKDNAANYSISTNMMTQLNAYEVAADNVAMGMDLVTTASDIISQMQDKGARLRALATQARNGTYGAQSLDAINAEARSLLSEISRLYTTSEYNGIDLFNRKEYEMSDQLPQAKDEYGGFIENPIEYSRSDIEAMTPLTVNVSNLNAGEKYSISTLEELEHLSYLVNSGVDTTNVEFVLGADIDLSAIDDWTPIGNSTYQFKGIFNGNGFIIENLTINSTGNELGFFGRTANGSKIKNLAIKNAQITKFGGVYHGSLAGRCASEVYNCYAEGSIMGGDNIGGLIGTLNGNGYLDASYFEGIVKAVSQAVGGVVGQAHTDVRNSFANSEVYGMGNAGGLIGDCRASVVNCYSEGVVDTYSSNPYNKNFGGLVGSAYVPHRDVIYKDCYVYSIVKYGEGSGFLSALVNTNDGVNFTKVDFINCKAREQSLNIVSRVMQASAGGVTILPDFDISTITDGISNLEKRNNNITLQVGINNKNSAQLVFDTSLEYSFTGVAGRIELESSLAVIDNFISLLSDKSTQLGAVQNRLDSALESISVNIENLTSSRSTIRDADIAEVSSEYIQQQILQQASATLMATANQSPSIALQLV